MSLAFRIRSIYLFPPRNPGNKFNWQISSSGQVHRRQLSDHCVFHSCDLIAFILLYFSYDAVFNSWDRSIRASVSPRQHGRIIPQSAKVAPHLCLNSSGSRRPVIRRTFPVETVKSTKRGRGGRVRGRHLFFSNDLIE